MAKGKYEKWLEPEGLTLLEGWARDGLTDEQIAHNIGISRETLRVWKNNYPVISGTLKKGKEIVDFEVENALLKRALGYNVKEVTRERLVDKGQKKRHNGECELTEKEWEFALKYFDHKCCYCGDPLTEPTKDHIKPLHDGGELTWSNVVPCCRSCNSSKKDNEMLSWYQKQPFYDPMKVQKINDYISFILRLGELQSEEAGPLVITKEITKEIAPDVTAQIFWLKNRRPDKWRDKPVEESSGDQNTSLADAINAAWEARKKDAP